MIDSPSEAETRFLERIERRVEFFRSLIDSGLAIYMPPDENQRSQTISTFVRRTARQKDLEKIRPDTLAHAETLIAGAFEEMQKLLPTDVQYRNRLRRTW